MMHPLESALFCCSGGTGDWFLAAITPRFAELATGRAPGLWRAIPERKGRMNVTVKRMVSVVVLTTLLQIGLASSAHAYLDPGSGSYIWQILLATFVGLGFLVKVYWSKLKAAAKRLFSRTEEAPKEKGDD
jgi:O-antigen/teichoic acid export membrane protein